GCQRIGFLAGPPHLLISSQRVAGYRAALAQHGLRGRPEHLLHCDFTQENAVAQTLKLISQRPMPDGLLVVSDRIAFPAIYVLRQEGVRIPDDMAIASFNNEPYAALQTPGLTSVSQPTQQMGIESVRLLLRQLNADHEQPSLETKVLGTQLVVRESSLRNALS
ncbi:MAG: substrate-binding domain-containing protein, partial [Hymenobacter sp.]|nr:substrate-binding domain-containing protein [Hymenobacter sp.]